jgi:hypothetical protein
MNETTVILKAARVTTMWISDEKRLVVAAFRPDATSIRVLRAIGGRAFRMDVNDETGEFTTGILWKMQELVVADDSKALNLLLAKA